MELSDTVRDAITLERVKITRETPDFFRVEYAGETYDIAKSRESSFVMGDNHPTTGDMLVMEEKLEQLLVPSTGIFQDDTVPIEYKEVMIFHEISEMQYREADFEDAHERAVNDEILYVVKFFDEKTREQYLEFARKYRALSEKPAELTDKPTDLDVPKFYKQLKGEVRWGQGHKSAYKTAESLLKGRAVTSMTLDNIVKRLHYEPASFYLGEDIGGYSHALLSALINKIPDSEGEVRLTLPPYYVIDINEWCIKTDGTPIKGRNARQRITDDFKEFLRRKNVTIICDEKTEPITF